jgi:glycosyltransferase involved in cell wall biosynthesis
VKKKSLKIAQVIASKGWGGREKVPLLLGEEYRRKGHQVSLWVNPDTPLGREAQKQGFSVESYRFGSYFNPSAFIDIGRALRQSNPDVIHVHHSRDLWALVPVLRMFNWKGPLLLSKHVESGVQKKDPLHRYLYQRVDLILSCSTMVQKNVVETCPIEADRVLVGYAPVDMNQFQFSSQARHKLRSAWKMEKNIIIGMVARLTPGKGHELILKTASLLAQKNPRLRFKIAGQASPDEKEYAQKLYQQKTEWGLDGILDYEGYLSDVPSFLSALDLVVHSAPAESFGLAIVEAMACRRPVIARQGGGVEDILRTPGGLIRGGILMDSDNPEDWAEEILKITRSKALIRKIQAESRENALRFSLETLAQKHLAWYQELLHSKAKTPFS